MRLVKKIKHSYRSSTGMIRFRVYNVYESITGSPNKPTYFVTDRYIVSDRVDKEGGPDLYRLICQRQEDTQFGYFLDTWKEVLLQSELDFVNKLFYQSQFESDDRSMGTDIIEV